jgi:hypothetical protein
VPPEHQRHVFVVPGGWGGGGLSERAIEKGIKANERGKEALPEAPAVVEKGVLQWHVCQPQVRIVHVPHQRPVPHHDFVERLVESDRKGGVGLNRRAEGNMACVCQNGQVAPVSMPLSVCAGARARVCVSISGSKLGSSPPRRVRCVFSISRAHVFLSAVLHCCRDEDLLHVPVEHGGKVGDDVKGEVDLVKQLANVAELLLLAPV